MPFLCSSSFRIAACVVGALCMPALAEAAPSQTETQDAPTPENIQYRKAFAAIAREDWADAERLLLPLWDKFHTWDIASSLGQAEFMLKKHAVGARYVAFAVANLPPKENSKVLKRLQTALSDMKATVGTVRIAVNKDGAEVLADHEQLGTSPLPTEVYLEPGSRQLEARTSDGATGKQTLDVVAGQTYQVALIVEKSNALPVVAPSGALPTTAPSTASEPTTSLAPEPAGSSTGRAPNWTPVLIGGGLAIVAVAVGTGFALDASSAKSDAANNLSSAQSSFGNNPCDPQKGGASKVCQDLHSNQDRRDSSATGATISFVAGGVLAIAAVGSYFLWPSPNSDHARMSGWVGPQSGGLSLQGSF